MELLNETLTMLRGACIASQILLAAQCGVAEAQEGVDRHDVALGMAIAQQGDTALRQIKTEATRLAPLALPDFEPGPLTGRQIDIRMASLDATRAHEPALLLGLHTASQARSHP